MANSGDDAATRLFQAALELILKDESFSIPSRPAIRARELARVQLDWSTRPENRPHFQSFSSELVRSLQECCVSHHSLRLERELMWENYFKLRSSEKFTTDWALFVSHFDSSRDSCPAFYQFVTDFIMEDIIKRTYPIECVQQEK